jgi:hypothetical protein
MSSGPENSLKQQMPAGQQISNCKGKSPKTFFEKKKKKKNDKRKGKNFQMIWLSDSGDRISPFTKKPIAQ